MWVTDRYTRKNYAIFNNNDLVLKDAVPAETPPEHDGWYRAIIFDMTVEDVKAAIRTQHARKTAVTEDETEKERLAAEMEKAITNAHEIYKSDTYLLKNSIWYTGSEDNHEKALTVAKRYKYEIANTRSKAKKDMLRHKRDAKIKQVFERSQAKPVIAYSREPVLEYTGCYVGDEEAAVRLVGANIKQTLKEYKMLLEGNDPPTEEKRKKRADAIKGVEREIRDQLIGYSTGADPEEVIEQYREQYGGVPSKRMLKTLFTTEEPGKADLTEAKRKIAEANDKSIGKKADPLKWSVFGNN